MQEPIVSNSSPIIHLAKIDQLDLLRDFFGELIIPEAVYKECITEGKGRPEVSRIKQVSWLRVVRVTYGSLQRWCDAPNLALHNLEIMNPCALMALADSPDLASVRAYSFGAMSPWIISLDKRLPHFAAKYISLGINAIGLLQPVTIDALSPMLVLEVWKKPN